MSELESTVIGKILIKQENLDDALGHVGADDFTLLQNRDIWAAILELDRAETSIDIFTVDNYLQTTLGRESSLAYLGNLAKNSLPTGIKTYVDELKKLTLSRALITAAGQVNEIAHSHGEIYGKVDQAQATISKVAEVESSSESVKVSDMLTHHTEMMSERLSADGSIIGLAMGFDALDELTGGLCGGDLVIIAGRPGSGKTTIAQNISENNPGNTYFASMEMPIIQLMDRSIARKSRVPLNLIRKAKMDDNDWTRYTVAVAGLRESGLIIDETPAQTIESLKSRARRAKRKHDISLMVIDYIQLMTASSPSSNRNTAIEEITRGLKGLAKELDVPIIALSQLNREVEKRPNKRPRLSDLRDSGAIEQDADIVMFVYRDEVYDKNTPDKGMGEIIIAKQRQGEIGTIPLAFEGCFCQFKNTTAMLSSQQDEANSSYGFDA